MSSLPARMDQSGPPGSRCEPGTWLALAVDGARPRGRALSAEDAHFREDFMSETPVHDWMMPRLRKLVAEAIQVGFDPLTVTAVITDIIASTDLVHEDRIDLTPTAVRIETPGGPGQTN